MANVSWSTSIQIAGGPTITATQGPFVAEATDRIEVTIPNATTLVVDLQPGPSSSIHILLIKSNVYSDNLTFITNDGTTDSTESIPLTGPQFYSRGSIDLFEQAPNKLKFTNASGAPVQIEIFVARDATP